MRTREEIVNEMHKVQAMTGQQFAEEYKAYDPDDKDEYMDELQDELDELDQEDEEDEDETIWTRNGFANESDYWRFVM